jgi:[acyl-carrier-protein] S-malonyltransferase
MKLAMVFPGQGSQAVGMLRAYAGLPGVEEARTEAGDVLGAEFLKLLDEGPAEALNLTVNTQPAMVTAGYAALRAWRALGGPEPEVLAGHSLGEYTALVAAGALRFADCLPLVRFRAQAMQAAVPEGEGAMAAILNLDDDAVRAACAEAAAGEVVEAVNFNAPGQVVIAGHKQAVARAMEACKAKGAKRALPLPVSAPFHSSLMRPAAERLRGYLAQVTLAAPGAQLINNVDVAIESQAAAIKDALVRQAAAPVRWVETVRRMRALGVTHVVECGPGKVLAGTVKRIEPALQGLALADKASLEQALAGLKGA